MLQRLLLSIVLVLGCFSAVLAQSISVSLKTDKLQIVDKEYWVEIEIGNPNEAEDLFGLSLKLHAEGLSTNYIEESAEPGDFLGNSVLSFFQAVDQQTVDMAVTKTSGEGNDGSGTVMRAKFVSAQSGFVKFDLLDVQALDSQGNSIQLNIEGINIEVTLEEVSEDTVSLSPKLTKQPSVSTEYWVEIEVGVDNPAEDVFGVSLKLQANNSTTTYIDGSGESGDFLGASALSFFQKVDDQTVDMAVTKTSGEGVNGSGIVTRAKFISSEVGLVTFTPVDVEVLDSQGNKVEVDITDIVVKVIEQEKAPDTVSIAPNLLGEPQKNIEYWVEIEVGVEDPAEDVYGVSLKLQAYNDSTIYVDGSGESGDFLGNSPLSFFKKVDNQTVDMAVTKTSGVGVDGSGVIMRAKFISTSDGDVKFRLKDVEILNSSGKLIESMVDSVSRIVVSAERHEELVKDYLLHQNYPNPFNPSTNIQFSLPEPSQVELKVFDLTGREVASLVSGMKTAGNHSVVFDAANLSSGIYIYRLKAGDFIQTKQMLLIK